MDTNKVLVFDVDGVLLDFSGPFAHFWNQGLRENKWEGNVLEGNPRTWRMGLSESDDRSTLDFAIEQFYKEHDPLPLLSDVIPDVLHHLKRHFQIHLVTAYPDEAKRIANLQHHNIPYDVLVCDVHDKVAYVKKLQANGLTISAIVEDGPHHLTRYLTCFEFPLKVYAPRRWKYLEQFYDDPRLRFYNQETDWFTFVYAGF